MIDSWDWLLIGLEHIPPPPLQEQSCADCGFQLRQKHKMSAPGILESLAPSLFLVRKWCVIRLHSIPIRKDPAFYKR